MASYGSPPTRGEFAATATGPVVGPARVLRSGVSNALSQPDFPTFAAAPQQRQPQYGTTPQPQPRYRPVMQKSGLPLTKEVFRGTGVLLLAVVCALPVWDAIALMQDFNYSYWVGPSLPMTVVAGSILMIVVFIFFTETSFGQMPSEQQTTQTLAMIVSLFMTMLGLMLILTSGTISMRANEAHNTLQYHGGTSQDTMALRDHYAALLALRKKDDCASKFSVVDCDGYQEVESHTAYLLAMETEFRCSGFCYNSPAGAGALQTNASGVAAAVGSGVASGGNKTIVQPSIAAATTGTSMLQLQHGRYIASAGSLLAETPLATASKYPPTLFSNANFQISCEGAASRQLVNFARELGYDGWYIGISLIGISVVMGLWEWKAIAEK